MDGITSATQAAASTAQTGSAKSLGDLSEDFDKFLKLLTTQLSNQDPLDPMDTQQFTQQLVQFSGVEQQIKTNSNLEDLISLQNSNALGQAVSMIGKTVEGSGNDLYLGPDGGEIAYALPEDASTGSVLIFDRNDKVVYAGQMDLSAGSHLFKWDGNDNAGEPLPQGAYTVQMSARDASDKAIEVETATRGVVTSVVTTEAGPTVMIGSVMLPLDKVDFVAEPAVDEG